ncbi:sigma-70 family RNA polymerase sigma factor [bacterium]|nr:sigma-70 family RNA polymerase sigma factor [bacterium]
MSETISTLDLVRSAQAGDAAAVERLFTRYRARMRRWAAGRLPGGVRGRLDTEDIVHDALSRTFERIGELDPRGGGFFQAYVRRAVMNTIRDQVAKKREHLPPTGVLERAADGGPSPLQELVGREVFDRYEAALAALTTKEREAVLARIEDHASWQEIAEEFGKESPDAARMMVKRALLKVAKGMGDDG